MNLLPHRTPLTRCMYQPVGHRNLTLRLIWMTTEPSTQETSKLGTNEIKSLIKFHYFAENENSLFFLSFFASRFPKAGTMIMKYRITEIGQPCRHCQTPVVKRIPTKQRKKAKYHYHYYLYCLNCKAMYMLESQKYYGEIKFSKKQNNLF